MDEQNKSQPAKVLTIGGSDSGGAAGIQADLKTWTALEVYGMSVITAVTAQNSVQVTSMHYLPPDLVAAQIDAVLSDYGAQAVKTGFIGKVDLITVIANGLRKYTPTHIIIDPVLVNHQRRPMFPTIVNETYGSHLLPLADLITPNWAEAVLLSGLPDTTVPDQENINKVFDRLHLIGAKNILITGIHKNDLVVDILSDGTQQRHLSTSWIDTENRHGSGDTLSAAICAFLAQDKPLLDAIAMGRNFTAHALETAKSWQLGKGHGPLAHFS